MTILLLSPQFCRIALKVIQNRYIFAHVCVEPRFVPFSEKVVQTHSITLCRTAQREVYWVKFIIYSGLRHSFAGAQDQKASAQFCIIKELLMLSFRKIVCTSFII